MNILSITGGGARFIIPCLILKEILAKISIKCKKPVSVKDVFSFFSGSSVGTIIIAGLLYPSNEIGIPKYTINDLIKIMCTKCNKIFESTCLENFLSLWGLIGPKYNNNNREKIFEEIFEEVQYGELLGSVIFPVFDTITDKPIYLLNTDKNYANLKIKDILTGTTAAPTYFNSKEIKIKDQLYNLIDSGVVTNNPDLLCYEYATKELQNKNEKKSSKDIYVVSIGTGYSKESENTSNWGLLNWLPYISSDLIEMNSENQNYELSLLTDNYTICDVELPSNINVLDNTSYISSYIKITNEWIEKNQELIEKIADNCMKNIKNK